MKSNGIMNDTEVRNAVLRELGREPRLNGAQIEVMVHHGVVTLVGIVKTADEFLAAMEAANRAEGVFEVVCELVVAPIKKAHTDAEIAAAVRNALEWDAMIPDKNLRIAVSNGWVALRGTVDLLREFKDAERTVRRLEGVRGVYNLIEVQPSSRTENVREAIEPAFF